MAIRLRAPARTLPLAFSETALHLRGDKAAYKTPQGEPLGGRALDRALDAEGIKAKKVHFAGYWRERTDDMDEPLRRWSRTIDVAGSLDVDSLARLAHSAARDFAGSFDKGDTPPEIYLTLIEVNAPTVPQKKPPRAPQRRKRVVYRDRETGAYVSRDTYHRSRRAMRAAAAKSGRRAGRGRFVRRVEFYTV